MVNGNHKPEQIQDSLKDQGEELVEVNLVENK